MNSKYPEPHQLLAPHIVGTKQYCYIINVNGTPLVATNTYNEAIETVNHVSTRLMDALAADPRVRKHELELTIEDSGDITKPGGRKIIICRRALGLIANGIKRETYVIQAEKVAYGSVTALTQDDQ